MASRAYKYEREEGIHEATAYQAITFLGFHEGVEDACRISEKALPLQPNSGRRLVCISLGTAETCAAVSNLLRTVLRDYYYGNDGQNYDYYGHSFN